MESEGEQNMMQKSKKPRCGSIKHYGVIWKMHWKSKMTVSAETNIMILPDHIL